MWGNHGVFMSVRFSLADRIRVASVARGEAVQAAAAHGPLLGADNVLDLCDRWFFRVGEQHVGVRLTVDELAEQLHHLAACSRVLAEDAERMAVAPDAAQLARGYATGMERAAYLLSLLQPTGIPR